MTTKTKPNKRQKYSDNLNKCHSVSSLHLSLFICIGSADSDSFRAQSDCHELECSKMKKS